MTIEQLKQLRESEDKVEFKAAKRNFDFDGGKRTDQSERRKCFLGYVVALANEGGGMLVLGMADKHPHEVVGTDFAKDKVGALVDQVYMRLQVRLRHEELESDGKRVLVFHVPTRPIGKMLRFEGVPLMRTGESLRNMSDDEMLSILTESEPDFSAKVCEGLRLNDLDPDALRRMRESYAEKQKNPRFLQLSDERMLTDLGLMSEKKLTNAALMLLARKEVLRDRLPQAQVIWEFRSTDHQIHHDNREAVSSPVMLGINEIWQLINQPSLNRKTPVQLGGYIFDTYGFNEEVLREAVLNAIAHRDYTISSEVVIKQFPNRLVISNPGGFPKGVDIHNILTVSSTPRCRLMTEAMEKTGLVERSGQGVDKIFSITLSEGKQRPDYTRSGLFQVTLELKADIIDRAMPVFLARYRDSGQQPGLGVDDIIALCQVRDGLFTSLRPDITERLEKAGLIVRMEAHTNRYTLHEEYLSLADEGMRIGNRYVVKEVDRLLLLLQDEPRKVGFLENALSGMVTRGQIKHALTKLMEDDIISSHGKLKGTRYALSASYSSLRGNELTQKVLSNLREQYLSSED
jgi:ATP-dependent DNA helicase RecG